jgi:hypothetical protein
MDVAKIDFNIAIKPRITESLVDFWLAWFIIKNSVI